MISDWMRFYVFFVTGDFVAGFIFKEEVQKQVRKPFLFLLLLPLFITVQIYYLRNNVGKTILSLSAWESFSTNHNHYLLYEANFLLIAFLGCTTLILFSFLLEKWNKLSFLRVLGYHSLYIYIIHVIIVGFVRLLLTKVFDITNIGVILITAITLGVTIPIIFYNRWGKTSLWFLFVPRKRTQQPTPIPSKREPIEILPLNPSSIGTDISST
jgi:surface polysaccharide O-acyltransferase-like enzyme